MLLELSILLIGLGALAKSSSFTITNAVKFSKASGINQMVVGFILIAVATSLPEFTIAIVSSLGGNGAISMGNIIGADIINITLVFAVMSFVGFKIQKKEMDDILLAAILVSIVSIFLIILRVSDLIMGLFMLIVFYTFARVLLDKNAMINHNTPEHSNTKKYALLCLGGIFAVILSANTVIHYATLLAVSLSLSETLIGATIISLGTTLPEMSVNLAALRKKNIELAIGDSVGTIVANITLILGVASIINPIIIDTVALAGLLYLLFALGLFVFLTNRLNFSKREGAILLLAYLSYVALVLMV